MHIKIISQSTIKKINHWTNSKEKKTHQFRENAESVSLRYASARSDNKINFVGLRCYFPLLQRWSEIIGTTTKNGIVLVATSN